ncbi:MAG TPA: YciI family protein [Acidimicrobiales bacterium]|nr:YciI family protein [Acidimicrobiales bacterium]
MADPIRLEGDAGTQPVLMHKELPTMKQYLLSVYQPDGPPPAAVDLEEITRDVNALADEMKAAGAWVFSDGLFPPTTATVVRLQDGEMLTTDGPYVEGKEHLGGLTIIQAPDLDAALEWGRKSARATTLPIEVRPFQRDAS